MYFQNFTFQTVLEIHNYNTRGCTNLRNSIVKHEFSRKFIRYQLPIVINNTPLIILNKAITHSITGFTEYIKKFCVSKYNTVCNKNHCYICNMLNQNCFFVLFNHIVFYSFIISSFALMVPKGGTADLLFPLELNKVLCFILPCRAKGHHLLTLQVCNCCLLVST